MKKSFLGRLSDITKIGHRASFSDVQQKITKYKYGSDAFRLGILRGRSAGMNQAFSENSVIAGRNLCNKLWNISRFVQSMVDENPSDVKSEDALARLRAIHPCYGAPVVLIVGCRNEEAWIRDTDGVNAAKTDAAIVLTHLMLTATDMGLANMWIWDFDPSKVREALPETQEHGIYALLAIGYPKGTEGKPTEYHSVRKPLEEIVRYL